MNLLHLRRSLMRWNVNSAHRYSWIEGIIKKKIGKALYLVYLPATHNEVTKHVDQLWHRSQCTQDGAPNSTRDCSSWIPDLVPDLTPETSTTNQGQEVPVSESEDVQSNQEEREKEQSNENINGSVSSPMSNVSEESQTYTQPAEIDENRDEEQVALSSSHSSEADANSEEPAASIQPERLLRERYNLDFRRFF
ncbi:hypothetical protein NE865_15331 [Phthorimaea operculella]|nr:hypothetical protein NE865_15331 [Phthorimaea operculella]